jgi:5'-3' exonuclease
MSTNLIIDFNHLAYRSLFGAKKDILDVGFGYFKHVILSGMFSLIRKFSPDEVVIAVDSNTNWRKQVFPEYKATRKEKRDAQEDINWADVFATMEELVEELKGFFPFKVMTIKYMEADDIIASLVRLYKTKNWIVVTSDSDYIQLLRYDNVKVYDAMKGGFMKSEDPLRELKIKILAGDSGDNVPCILKESTSETIKKKGKKDPVRVTLGEKGAEDYLDPVEFKKLMEDSTVLLSENGEALMNESSQVTIGERAKKGFKRNSILIDLQNVPEKLMIACKNEYEDYEMPDGKMIFQYFVKNKFHEFIGKAEVIEQSIKSLYENYSKEKEMFS